MGNGTVEETLSSYNSLSVGEKKTREGLGVRGGVQKLKGDVQSGVKCFGDCPPGGREQGERIWKGKDGRK